MSGYGSADDEAQRAMIRVEEQIALAQSLLPRGKGSPTCLDCGDSIPEARRKALPGVVCCVDCQSIRDDNRRIVVREPWAT